MNSYASPTCKKFFCQPCFKTSGMIRGNCVTWSHCAITDYKNRTKPNWTKNKKKTGWNRTQKDTLFCIFIGIYLFIYLFIQNISTSYDKKRTKPNSTKKKKQHKNKMAEIGLFSKKERKRHNTYIIVHIICKTFVYAKYINCFSM